jgi:hypothetical protein
MAAFSPLPAMARPGEACEATRARGGSLARVSVAACHGEAGQPHARRWQHERAMERRCSGSSEPGAAESSMIGVGN